MDEPSEHEQQGDFQAAHNNLARPQKASTPTDAQPAAAPPPEDNNADISAIADLGYN
ncbi:MAG TPA: hypothetical protein VFA48_04850 [Gammaproteobacteria bacterium]|nr:hypothetical protein [Gammaproteobacteria bacterium]